MPTKIAKDRRSVFSELGLDTDRPTGPYSSEQEFSELTGLPSPTSPRAPESANDNAGEDRMSDSGRQSQQGKGDPVAPTHQQTSTATSKMPWYSRLGCGRRPRIRTISSAPPPSQFSLTRLSAIALLIAVVLPGFRIYKSGEEVSPNTADAGVIRNKPRAPGAQLDPRAESPTNVCRRWAHQTAQLNGTLYIYGGQAKSSEDQTTDTWNNNFLTLDLTKSWDTSSPALRGLPRPSGVPAVSLGYLWNDYNNLYLYGGQFADNPFVQPAPVSTWKYSIGTQTWTEYPSPRTSAGNNSDAGDHPVQRAAEGAGLSVPELGLSWYFGGHLDQSTTPGWSNQIARVYLKSLLEFTHPGYTNDGVFSLADGTGAGDGGVYRNITEGGLQIAEGFSERADGVLVFVPGWGDKGVLIGLAGGTVDTFTDDLSTLDVYDIARSEWYHQQTTGDTPSVRVNPCAVTASAPDASSFQIYLYGGQNLQPYGNQTQYSDMYILSIPAFTWIKVDQSGSNMPPARAGHTCNLRDGQIIVVGGYTGNTPSCDSPGIYVFNATSLQWQSRYNALDHPADLHPENSVLANSYGYQVPDAVARVIGGDSNGGATATTPAAGPATRGPFATGKPPVFTITASGSTATVTQWGPGATSTSTTTATTTGGPSSSDPGGNGDDRRSGALIAAGVVAGLAGLAAAYLGYCAWLYWRQVRAYRSHLAVVNRYSAGAAGGGGGGGGVTSASELGVAAGGGGSILGRQASRASSGGGSRPAGGGGEAAEKEVWVGGTTWAEKGKERERERDRDKQQQQRVLHRVSTSTAGSVGWAVPATEPRYLFDDGGGRASSVSGSGSGSGSGPIARTAGPSSRPPRRSASVSGETTSSTERLLDGQEPSFVNIVLGPRRALRVVNGLEGEVGGE
ncbi:hypothetical protein VTK56DRAFT_9817 [Thermocarpiscus australiensis]